MTAKPSFLRTTSRILNGNRPSTTDLDIIRALQKYSVSKITQSTWNEEHAKWIDLGGSSIDEHEALTIYDAFSYRAPEPPRPDVSVELDIFAFGCAVYDIETGLAPYFDETKDLDPSYLMTYMEDKYRQGLYPSTENLRYPSIITGCWHERYGSMGDLRRELDLIDARQSSAAGCSRLLLALMSVWRVVREKIVGIWRLLSRTGCTLALGLDIDSSLPSLNDRVRQA